MRERTRRLDFSCLLLPSCSAFAISLPSSSANLTKPGTAFTISLFILLASAPQAVVEYEDIAVKGWKQVHQVPVVSTVHGPLLTRLCDIHDFKFGKRNFAPPGIPPFSPTWSLCFVFLSVFNETKDWFRKHARQREEGVHYDISICSLMFAPDQNGAAVSALLSIPPLLSGSPLTSAFSLSSLHIMLVGPGGEHGHKPRGVS